MTGQRLLSQVEKRPDESGWTGIWLIPARRYAVTSVLIARLLKINRFTTVTKVVSLLLCDPTDLSAAPCAFALRSLNPDSGRHPNTGELPRGFSRPVPEFRPRYTTCDLGTV
jgi:hypothetical protein